MMIVPSWVAYLIRLYALKTIMGRKGIINTFLLNLGVISDPLEMLYTPIYRNGGAGVHLAAVYGIAVARLPWRALSLRCWRRPPIWAQIR